MEGQGCWEDYLPEGKPWRGTANQNQTLLRPKGVTEPQTDPGLRLGAGTLGRRGQCPAPNQGSRVGREMQPLES